MGIHVNQSEHYTLLIPQTSLSVASELDGNAFESDFWLQQNAITGQSVGRNITWFVRHQDKDWVLRHYHRGGLVQKLLGDRYFYSSLANTRCYRELALLEQMHLQNLPVPRPIAGRVVRRGLFYRADLLIEKIPQSQDLVHWLKQQPLSDNQWHQLGALIAKFHGAGIYHSDLNAHNILIDGGQNFWLIDFDKCEKRVIDDDWQQANLKRLLRSFEKEAGLYNRFEFNNQWWQCLIEGYKKFESQ